MYYTTWSGYCSVFGFGLVGLELLYFAAAVLWGSQLDEVLHYY